jgi:hypothetical protein
VGPRLVISALGICGATMVHRLPAGQSLKNSSWSQGPWSHVRCYSLGPNLPGATYFANFFPLRGPATYGRFLCRCTWIPKTRYMDYSCSSYPCSASLDSTYICTEGGHMCRVPVKIHGSWGRGPSVLFVAPAAGVPHVCGSCVHGGRPSRVQATCELWVLPTLVWRIAE